MEITNGFRISKVYIPLEITHIPENDALASQEELLFLHGQVRNCLERSGAEPRFRAEALWDHDTYDYSLSFTPADIALHLPEAGMLLNLLGIQPHFDALDLSYEAMQTEDYDHIDLAELTGVPGGATFEYPINVSRAGIMAYYNPNESYFGGDSLYEERSYALNKEPSCAVKSWLETDQKRLAPIGRTTCQILAKTMILIADCRVLTPFDD